MWTILLKSCYLSIVVIWPPRGLYFVLRIADIRFIIESQIVVFTEKFLKYIFSWLLIYGLIFKKKCGYDGYLVRLEALL